MCACVCTNNRCNPVYKVNLSVIHYILHTHTVYIVTPREAWQGLAVSLQQLIYIITIVCTIAISPRANNRITRLIKQTLGQLRNKVKPRDMHMRLLNENLFLPWHTTWHIGLLVLVCFTFTGKCSFNKLTIQLWNSINKNTYLLFKMTPRNSFWTQTSSIAHGNYRKFLNSKPTKV